MLMNIFHQSHRSSITDVQGKLNFSNIHGLHQKKKTAQFDRTDTRNSYTSANQTNEMH